MDPNSPFPLPSYLAPSLESPVHAPSRPNADESQRVREATETICAGMLQARGGLGSRCGETNERCLAQARLCGGSGEGLRPTSAGRKPESGDSKHLWKSLGKDEIEVWP